MREAIWLVAMVMGAGAQEPTVAPATFFSGSVVAASTTEVTVHRRALMSNAVTKTFVIDPETKIEGKLRVKANVTVRYETDDEGRTRAVSIIVR